MDQLETEATRQDTPKTKPPKCLSETDLEAAWSIKSGPGRFAYEANYLVDDRHAIIMDVHATPARLSQEIAAAKAMLKRSAEVFGLEPTDVVADKSYGIGPFLAWLLDRGLTPIDVPPSNHTSCYETSWCHHACIFCKLSSLAALAIDG